MDFWTDPLGLIRAWLLSLLMSIGLTADAAGVALIVLGTVVVGGLGLTLPLALIYIERRLIGRFQDRIGPNRVGPEGIFQTVADANLPDRRRRHQAPHQRRHHAAGRRQIHLQPRPGHGRGLGV